MHLFKSKFSTMARKIAITIRQNNGVQEHGVTASINRIYWSAPFMAVGSIFIALMFSKKYEIANSIEAHWRGQIIFIHLINSVITMSVWLISSWLRKNQAKKTTNRIFLYVVVSYVLALGIRITLIDQLVTARIAPFLLTSTMVGFLYYLRPRVFVVFYFLNFTVFNLVITNYVTENTILLDSIISNGLIASFLGLSLAILNWRAFRTNKLQNDQIKEQRDVLERMAYQDPLTHLPNRRLLDELIRRELHLIRRGEIGSCLIIIDLDSFKSVNDSYGHPAGDTVLQQFAHLLQKNMRGSNTLVRLGGEEFVILSSNTSIDEALILAERLRKLIEAHDFSVEGKIIKITASFGVAPLIGTEDLKDYYGMADRALYRAKQRGKNQVAI